MSFTALIDVDQVSLRTIDAWLYLYNRDYKDVLQPKDIIKWQIADLVKPECGKKIYDYLYGEELYSIIEPMPGANHAFEILRRWDCKIKFVTASTNPWQLEALERHGLIDADVDDYIREEAKYKIAGDVIIDDNVPNVLDYPKAAILFVAPHNQGLIPLLPPRIYVAHRFWEVLHQVKTIRYYAGYNNHPLPYQVGEAMASHQEP